MACLTGGRLSVTTTFWASAGPLLVTVMMYWTVEEGLYTSGSLDLRIWRSSTAMVVSSVSRLLELFGSKVSAETLASSWARFSRPGSTLTTMVMVSLPPGGIESKVQVVGRKGSPGTPALQDPPVEETDRMLTPAGRWSVTTTFTAVDGPLLDTSRV